MYSSIQKIVADVVSPARVENVSLESTLLKMLKTCLSCSPSVCWYLIWS